MIQPFPKGHPLVFLFPITAQNTNSFIAATLTANGYLTCALVEALRARVKISYKLNVFTLTLSAGSMAHSVGSWSEKRSQEMIKSTSPMSPLMAAESNAHAAEDLLERLNKSHSTWERVSSRAFDERRDTPGVVWAVTNDDRYFASHSSLGLSEYRAGKRIRELLNKGCAVHPSILDFSGLNRMQRVALRMACTEPASVVNGLPGAGKTFLARRIYETMTAMGLSCVGCAFTGSAAGRLQESTGMPCKTVHMLLGYDGNDFEYNEENNLPYDHIFLDELSQVDIVLYWTLIRALKPGARITHMGDHNQIGSVNAGDVLNGLRKSIPTTTLEEMVRADPQGPIGMSLMRILDGMPPESFGNKNEGGVFFLVADDSNIPRYCEKGMKRISDIEGTSVVRSLTYTNLICDQINVHCVKRFDHIPLIARRNNYDHGYFNGDSADYQVVEDKEFARLRDGRLVPYGSDFTLGYASTINVAQGQQFRGVVIAVGNEGIGIPNRNFSLTGLTRAEKWALIVGSYRNFEESLSRSDFNRVSLLGEFVSGSATLASKELGE